MKLLKKLWTELTRTRAIEFISYETAEETNSRLALELKTKIEQIKSENKEKLMREKIIPYFRDLELSASGILLSDEKLRPKAEASLNLALTYGYIDEFYNIVRTE